MRIILLALALLMPFSAGAQTPSPNPSLAEVLAENSATLEQPQRATVGRLLDAIVATGDPNAPALLEAWADRRLYLRKADGAAFIGAGSGTLQLTDAATGQDSGSAPAADFDQLRPGGGVRSAIATALVQFQLSDPDRDRRATALNAIARSPDPEHLEALRDALDDPDPALAARKQRLERILTIRFDRDPAARIAAIEEFGGDTGLDLRGALNPLVATRRVVTDGAEPAGNIAARLVPGDDISTEDAYALLVQAGNAPPLLDRSDQRRLLAENVENGAVAGIPLHQLNTQAARDRAYDALEAVGRVPAGATAAEVAAALAAHAFWDVYAEPNPAVTDAANEALGRIGLRVKLMGFADLALDALSLGSIFFLAAIGLAITFGVMRVINMAHGDFIMLGAYTGYVTQTVIADHTLSIAVALPLAFAVTFAAGVTMERLVIRHLYHRPLETLLATFGISIALQQIVKNVFGTQARPLTAPSWLDGQLAFNDVVAISNIRVAIFVMAVMFLLLTLYVMKRTRLGLEVRAVTQNPRMAASMGINPDRINMLTFGLGSGIAGIAGVAIGLFAKVTSELGNDYIVQSFMTVVVGGVGNIWGTLLGAGLIGSLQKVIESFNPSNTLAAQTFMILFIILFIQFRPRGIIALRGRAAGD